MALALRHIKVYFKLTVTVLAILAALLVVWMNRGHRVSVWFFHDFRDIPVLWLIFITAAIAIAGSWIVPTVWRTVADYRQIQREKKESTPTRPDSDKPKA